jgi:hypothetical protein
MTLAAAEKGAAPSFAAIGYGHGGLNLRHFFIYLADITCNYDISP